jgi:archaellum component FlaC
LKEAVTDIDADIATLEAEQAEQAKRLQEWREKLKKLVEVR